MISEPVPVAHRMGASPMTVVATVIAFGRTRSTAPSRIASRSAASSVRPAATRASPRLLEINEHDDAELGRHAGQPDGTRRARDRHVVVQAQSSHTPPTTENGKVP